MLKEEGEGEEGTRGVEMGVWGRGGRGRWGGGLRAEAESGGY